MNRQKEDTMKKSVRINEEQNQLYLLVVWDFAYRNARKSDWEKVYLDKLRFKRRIKDCEIELSNVFSKTHRMLIYNERFIVKK